MKRTIALAAILSSLAVAASPSFAGETGLPEDFDLSAGIAFTTNYVSKGVTQTEDKPAVQGYLEATYGVFYLGAWASNTSFDDPWDPSSEIDFYGGIRPEIGNLSLDIGFAKYYYPDYPTENYGDIYVKGSFAFTESFSAGAEFFHEIYGGPEWGNLTTEVALPQEVSFSGKIGSDFQSGGRVAWDAGLSRTFMDLATVDLRYYDSNMDPAKFVATLSFDLSLSDMLGGGN